MRLRLLTGFGALALCATLAGCAKKNVAAAHPPAPAVTNTPVTPARNPVPQAVRQTPRETAALERSTMPDAATRARIQDLLNRIQDAYFDYDNHNIRPDAQVALQKDAGTLSEILRQYPNYRLTVQGHCDERGSEEYNLALGDARAKKAKEYVVTLGIPGSQLQTISYSKDRPVCFDHNEACWQKNRRAHITQDQNP